MKTIVLPQLRQTFNYDCGALALQSILVYYGIEIREDHVIDSAGTTENGTPIEGILKTASRYGLKTDSRQMNIDDIRSYIEKDIPVMLIVQAWAEDKNVDWARDWVDGHYVVAIGYAEDKIIFEDPSSFERTYLKYDELNERWHDVDAEGRRFVHYGIAIYGKDPEFERDEIVHMD